MQRFPSVIQARLIKRIVCLVFCVSFLVSCGSTVKVSHVEPDIAFSNYKAVVIRNSDARVSVEIYGSLQLQLADLFRNLGYAIIGEEETHDYPDNTILSVLYNGKLVHSRIGVLVEATYIAIVEDKTTGKTLCTAEATSRATGDNSNEAKKEMLNELQKVILKNK